MEDKILWLLITIKELLAVRSSEDIIRVMCIIFVIWMISNVFIHIVGFAKNLHRRDEEARRKKIAQQVVLLLGAFRKVYDRVYEKQRALIRYVSRGLIDISISYWLKLKYRYWPKVKTNIRHPLWVLRVVILALLVLKILLLFL